MTTNQKTSPAAEQYRDYLGDLKYFDNTANVTSGYHHHDILSLANFANAHREITNWHGYKPTPTHNLAELARQTGVKKIYYKDESNRFSLKSFKALGGAYAVAKLLLAKLSDAGIRADSKDLLNGKYADITAPITVSCATDGNHGRSVAWAAKMFHCNCEIFIHQHVSDSRADAIAKFGAVINRVRGNYDDSVRAAAKAAQENGYYTVSDTSYDDYTEIPKDVMQGYTLMVAEALQQIAAPPSHVFVQGGVGGLAAAVVSFIVETYADGDAARDLVTDAVREHSPADSPIFVIIEPTNADCLLQSAKNGVITEVGGSLQTVMAGLSCGEVSTLAWTILKDKVHGFCAIPDDPVAQVMRHLAAREQPIVSGESAVAGLAGYLILQCDDRYRQALHIDQNSRILCFGTEGDTDADIYKKLVGKTAEQVLMTT